MIILKATTESLKLTSSSTAGLDYSVSWVDVTTTTFSPSSTEGKITTATNTTITAAPAASTQRQIKTINIRNIHASTSNIISVYKDISGTTYQLTTNYTLAAGESLTYTAEGEWIYYSASGMKKVAPAPSDIQIFTATGAGTWTKPTWFDATFVKVILIGGGGAGGGGGADSGAVTRQGGHAGGGGAYNEKVFLASSLGVTEALNVGVGGTGGAGGLSNSDGADGTSGGNSTFGTVVRIGAYGGGGGGGGHANGGVSRSPGGGGGSLSAGQHGLTGTLGGLPSDQVEPHNTHLWGGGTQEAGAGLLRNSCSYYGGGAGDKGSSVFGGGGGGEGGDVTGTPAVSQPTAGGKGGSHTEGGGGAAGTSGNSPTAGANGADGSELFYAGSGGGGGGSTILSNTTGAAGGDGGIMGGGGGGGGCGNNTGSGGVGGDGGRGQIWVISY